MWRRASGWRFRLLRVVWQRRGGSTRFALLRGGVLGELLEANPEIRPVIPGVILRSRRG